MASPPDFLGRWPAAIDLLAVERVVAALGPDVPWAKWVETLPLVPRIDVTARLNELDRIIVRLLPHLQHVCHKPRLYLRLDEERLPISRARRIPERATAVLAAHPEDWEHQTLRSVRPSRVLATHAEDQWDLYENRVAVRLVDHLLLYVGDRVDALQRVQQMYDEGSDFQRDTTGFYRRAQRLFRLWGTYFEDNALARELGETLRTLESAQNSLRALLGSPLYREIPRRVLVPLSLRSTNILVNDGHYRRVAELWREWVKRGHVAQPTREALRKQRQAEVRAFDSFVRLVIVRALADLGFELGERHASGALTLRSGRHTTAFAVGGDGVVSLQAGERCLRIVPLLGSFAQDEMYPLWAGLSLIRGDVAVALLGRPRDLLQEDDRMQRAFQAWESPAAFVVSPWSIDSVERTARVIAGWFARVDMGDFPPRRLVRPDPGVVLPKWLRRMGAEVVAIRPATEGETSVFKTVCARRRAELDNDELRARKTRERFDPGLRNALVPLLEVVDDSRDLTRLAQCPVCDADASAGFTGRIDGGGSRTWWCVCACEAQWGTRACTACGAAFAVLIPAPAVRHPGVEPGWIDRTYGHDVWSEPCAIGDRPGVFRCSNCGVCPAGGCPRCTS